MADTLYCPAGTDCVAASGNNGFTCFGKMATPTTASTTRTTDDVPASTTQACYTCPSGSRCFKIDSTVPYGYDAKNNKLGTCSKTLSTVPPTGSAVLLPNESCNMGGGFEWWYLVLIILGVVVLIIIIVLATRKSKTSYNSSSSSVYSS